MFTEYEYEYDRVAEVGSLSSRAKMAMKIFVRRVFTISKKSKKCVNCHNLNSRQNSVFSGLKFSSESKLSGGCHPCSRATSATLSPSSSSWPLRTPELLPPKTNHHHSCRQRHRHCCCCCYHLKCINHHIRHQSHLLHYCQLS